MGGGLADDITLPAAIRLLSPPRAGFSLTPSVDFQAVFLTAMHTQKHLPSNSKLNFSGTAPKRLNLGESAMIFRLLFWLAICCTAGGCASQFAKGYLGKDTVELELENGKPANVISLPDGRRSYQYYWGGGTFVTPQTTSGTVNVIGNTAFVQTQTTPGAVVSSPGCIINFIAEQRGARWVVVDARWPDRLMC